MYMDKEFTAVNAWFTPKSGIRKNKVVRYMGWAVPQSIYVDFDLIQNAPEHINKAGLGDVFCIHTGHYDWKLATRRDKGKKFFKEL